MAENEEVPDECYSCGFPGVELKSYRKPLGSNDDVSWYCAVCAGSLISTGLYSDHSKVLRSLGFCTNLILQAIKQSKG